jgi:hypothetical protein
MLVWLRVFLVIISPLLIVSLGLNIAVFLGYVITWIMKFGPTASSFFGFLNVPKSMQLDLEAPLVVVNTFAPLYFLWLLRLPIRAARKNNLSIKEFALLPWRDRRELVKRSCS